MKKGLFTGIVTLLAVGTMAACSPKEEKHHESSEPKTTQTTIVESSSQEQNQESYELTTSDKESLQLTVFEEALGSFGNTRFDPRLKAYVLTPTDPDLIAGMEGVLNGTVDKGSWIELVNAVISSNNTMNNSLGGGYSTVIENPYESGQMILAVKDGEVIHDGVAKVAGFTY